MANSARIDELKKKFDENPRRYFAPLANEFRKSGEIEQAIMICEEFLPQQPGHMSGHIVYGQALYEAARYPESRTVFETALGLDPENLIALRHLGDIAKGEGDVAGARNWYLRVLDADPRNDEIQALIASIGVEAKAADDDSATVLTTAEPEESEEFIPSFMKETVPPAAAALQPSENAPLENAFELEAPAMHAPVIEAPAAFDPSIIDTLPSGMPAVSPDWTPSAEVSMETELLSGFSTHDFDTPAIGSSSIPESTAAEGLESTSFVAPVDDRIESLDLDDSLTSGIPEFVAPASARDVLPGLQGSGGIAHDELQISEPPSVDLEMLDVDALEIDDGSSTTPHGDPVSSTAPTPIVATPVVPDHLFDDMPLASGIPSEDVEQSMTSEQNTSFDESLTSERIDDIPMELPPSVIAAEAELIDASATDALGPSVTPFVTETMAELYVAQGFREEALNVYQQLLAANPEDQRLGAIVERLSPSAQADEDIAGAVSSLEVHDDSPRARDFFAMIASKRPGASRAAAQPPSDYDFSSEAPPAEADLEAEEQSSGSIDALFGGSAPRGAEDSAAAALAQAFGSATPSEPMIVGKAARAAEDELSLDSVFRDAPQRANRTSQSFSFDQFFAGGTPTASPRIPQPNAEAAPAERSADDIEQFNAWLQGLKPK